MLPNVPECSTRRGQTSPRHEDLLRLLQRRVGHFATTVDLAAAAASSQHGPWAQHDPQAQHVNFCFEIFRYVIFMFFVSTERKQLL